jgi:hypothetical protein
VDIINIIEIADKDRLKVMPLPMNSTSVSSRIDISNHEIVLAT